MNNVSISEGDLSPQIMYVKEGVTRQWNEDVFTIERITELTELNKEIYVNKRYNPNLLKVQANATDKEKEKALNNAIKLSCWGFSLDPKVIGEKPNRSHDYTTSMFLTIDVDIIKVNGKRIELTPAQIDAAWEKISKDFAGKCRLLYQTFNGGFRLMFELSAPAGNEATYFATMESQQEMIIGYLKFAGLAKMYEIDTTRNLKLGDLYLFGREPDRINWNETPELVELVQTTPVITTLETAGSKLPAMDLSPSLGAGAGSSTDWKPLSEKDKAKLMDALKTYAKRGGFSNRNGAWLELGGALFEEGFKWQDWLELSDIETYGEDNLTLEILTNWKSFKRDYPGRKSRIGTLIYFAQQVDPYFRLDTGKAKEAKVSRGQVLDKVRAYTDQYVSENIKRLERSFLIANEATATWDSIGRVELDDRMYGNVFFFMQDVDPELKNTPMLYKPEMHVLVSRAVNTAFPIPMDDSAAYSQNLIGFQNVTYHTDSKTFTPPAKDDLLTYRIGQDIDVEYYESLNEETVKESEVYKFVNSLFPNEAITVDFILKFWAVSMTPVIVKDFVIFIGKKDSGKTTLCNAMELSIGKHNVSHVSLMDLSNEKIKFRNANLEGKPLNLSSEGDNMKRVENSGTIKRITGNDYILIEYKQQDVYYIKAFNKLIFAVNNEPLSNDYSDAWYERQHLINFPYHFVVDQDKLDTVDNATVFSGVKYFETTFNYSQVVAVLLWYFHKWQNEGFIESDRMRSARDENRKKSNFVYRWASEHIEVTGYKENTAQLADKSSGGLYGKFREDAISEGYSGYIPNAATFSNQLQDALVDDMKTGKVWITTPHNKKTFYGLRYIE